MDTVQCTKRIPKVTAKSLKESLLLVNTAGITKERHSTLSPESESVGEFHKGKDDGCFTPLNKEA